MSINAPMLTLRMPATYAPCPRGTSMGDNHLRHSRRSADSRIRGIGNHELGSSACLVPHRKPPGAGVEAQSQFMKECIHACV